MALVYDIDISYQSDFKTLIILLRSDILIANDTQIIFIISMLIPIVSFKYLQNFTPILFVQ